MRWGRRHSNNGLMVFTFVLSLAIIATFFIIERNIRPTLITLAEKKAEILAIQIINSAINEEMIANTEYQDLVHIHKDIRGRIVLIQPNTGAISKLATKTSTYVQAKLEGLKSQNIYIPAGQISRSFLLANVGPRLKISIIPIGTVNVRVNSTFEEAGINQTLHQLFLEVEANIQVVTPLIRSVTTIRTVLPLVETVIIGEVPEHYLQLQCH